MFKSTVVMPKPNRPSGAGLLVVSWIFVTVSLICFPTVISPPKIFKLKFTPILLYCYDYRLSMGNLEVELTYEIIQGFSAPFLNKPNQSQKRYVLKHVAIVQHIVFFRKLKKTTYSDLF